MDHDELKHRRGRLGLTQRELAHVCGITETTIRRYEMAPDRNSARPVHPAVARIVEWLCNGWRPPEWPARRR